MSDIEEKYKRIQVTTHRASQGGLYKPGVLTQPPTERHFYYPHGDYDEAIAQLIGAGFVEGGVSPHARNFYTDE